jgi:hypothetical protein
VHAAQLPGHDMAAGRSSDFYDRSGMSVMPAYEAILKLDVVPWAPERLV